MVDILKYIEAKKRLSPKEKAGQLFMPAAFINDTEEEILEIEKLIKEHHVGSLCFFHSRASAATNFEGKKKIVKNEDSFETLQKLIQRYQKVAKYPLLIAIDAEWGLSMRIENTPQYPYAITLGALKDNENLIFKIGQHIAKDCKAAGVHWNLAPCVDLNSNPNNPVIGYRSFGADKVKVAKKASAFVRGTQSEGVLTSIKHFPGHGDTATDSHLDLPLIDKPKQELVLNELYPFQKLIEEGIDSIMIGHLSVPALANGATVSSSVSKDIIKGVLRDQMGYDGVVISDALNMHAVSKDFPIKGELEWLAFDAGNDVLCFAENVREGIETILQNATEAQIEESFERIWSLKTKALRTNSSSELTDSSDLNRRIAEKSITLYKGDEAKIADFRKTNFCTLTLKRNSDEDNSDSIKRLEIIKSEVANEKSVLLLLTPPQSKPTNTFGFLQQEIIFISNLLRTKNVVLYLFGNPYVLKHINIDNAVAVVIVYQNFKVFQDVAVQHFLGNLKAVGKLPVNI
ncbi:glycoside hydrolase family 3 protein [Costertonia aggregata]|uniref:beta-N-acetylhexosaminidase n=1 Tax=Costertonia aggregata TaxID=343403 RepID=A0A7H9AKU3_9FLAO|nr:glycoside hydrolase family 3 protein [Costertonia aggregata]QLG44070.1 glycoside hydrolase family 3 protein [Costertonia aggregata]